MLTVKIFDLEYGSAVEILEFDQDEYGHNEQNDQYITTINNLN
jgi:hypothetical protein